MAIALLDGTANTVDIAIAVSGTSTSSLRCVIGAAEYDSTRSFQDQTTLCSGKWVAESPSRNQDFLRITRYASQGSNISDLSGLMTATTPANVVVTLQTGNTKTGTFFADRETFNVAAGSVGIPGIFSMRSSGAIATVWVTS